MQSTVLITVPITSLSSGHNSSVASDSRCIIQCDHILLASGAACLIKACSPSPLPHFYVVAGLAWSYSYDPESYAGGSVATGRTSHAVPVKGDDPDDPPGPSCPSPVLSISILV
jgi:hypothetical protein